MTWFVSSRRPRSFDCPFSLQDGEAVWTSPVCRLTDCHTAARQWDGIASTHRAAAAMESNSAPTLGHCQTERQRRSHTPQSLWSYGASTIRSSDRSTRTKWIHCLPRMAAWQPRTHRRCWGEGEKAGEGDGFMAARCGLLPYPTASGTHPDGRNLKRT